METPEKLAMTAGLVAAGATPAYLFAPKVYEEYGLPREIAELEQCIGSAALNSGVAKGCDLGDLTRKIQGSPEDTWTWRVIDGELVGTQPVTFSQETVEAYLQNKKDSNIKTEPYVGAGAAVGVGLVVVLAVWGPRAIKSWWKRGGLADDKFDPINRDEPKPEILALAQKEIPPVLVSDTLQLVPDASPAPLPAIVQGLSDETAI